MVRTSACSSAEPGRRMSQADAFLEAIQEHPEDDAHRLVFADWLEDHGQEARAAFIRAQVRLAALPEDEPGREALEDEADDLLAEHEPAWAAAVSPVAPLWEWRRGFIEQVTLPAERLLSVGERLFRSAPVRAVRLLAGGADTAALARCRHLARVEELRLDPAVGVPDTPGFLSDLDVQKLLRSPHLGRLRELDLSGLHCELPSVLALRESGLLGRLQRLDLSGDRAIGDRAVALLADTPAPRLESLGLRATNLTAFGMKALFRAGRWPRLHTLSVDAAQL